VYHPQGTHVLPSMTPEQRRRAQRWELPAVIVALLVIPYLVLNYFAPSGTLGTIVDVLYFGIWGFFVVEALAMLRLAPDNLEWLRHNVLDVVIIVLTAPFEFLPPDFEVLQCLWVLRILDLLPTIHRYLFRITVVRFAFLLWGLTVLGGGIAYAELERGAEEPPTLFDGFYWVNTTISTVGYGDFLPTNPETKILAMGLQAMGVVLGAILVAGILPLFDREFAEGFSRRVAEKVERLTGEVDELEQDIADIDAEIEKIARGESSQDRVLAQIAFDIADLRQKMGAGGPHAPPGASGDGGARTGGEAVGAAPDAAPDPDAEVDKT
jgi:voltage-gated potassium channel